ncbi:MAG TPA: hypothetical protein VFL27_03350 [Candidatus Dormibacteraeota bacterium]|nr:hypothetical protein [Candidatus Dormibacteraeota bacterium]
MRWLQNQLGQWISITARAERAPTRLTLAITLGELPDGWFYRRNHARTWSGLAGLLLIAPFIVLVLAAALQTAGVRAPYAWIATQPAAIIAATVSLFIGIPVAIAMNLWRITRVGVKHHTNSLEGLVALQFAPLHLIVVAAALVAGAGFIAHLAADGYACWNGVHSAC